MAIYIAVVRYPDNHVQYAIYYTTDTVGRELYESADDARAALAAGDDKPPPSQWPDDAEMVTVHPYELYGDATIAFTSLASRRYAWLTGPTSALDADRRAPSQHDIDWTRGR